MNLALFDFDGTITFGDTFTPFVRLSASPRRTLAGLILLSPMIVGYELGVVPATRMRSAVARVCFRGRREADVFELGARYAETLDGRVRPAALEKIRWHQAHGDTVVVVSASLAPYLRHWCERLKLELICTELESASGTLTGKYRGGDCTGPEKARRVRERFDLSRYSVVYAYGDTEEDRELLDLASKRYLRWCEIS
jgi:HAD superfamily hydrolase (TIGR01490 family)